MEVGEGVQSRDGGESGLIAFATLLAIHNVTVEDEKLDLVCPAVVTLNSARIVAGTPVPISPDMAATADIRTYRRTLLSYLLSPIDEARSGAGRER